LHDFFVGVVVDAGKAGKDSAEAFKNAVDSTKQQEEKATAVPTAKDMKGKGRFSSFGMKFGGIGSFAAATENHKLAKQDKTTFAAATAEAERIKKDKNLDTYTISKNGQVY
jgi:hypothetical protein